MVDCQGQKFLLLAVAGMQRPAHPGAVGHRHRGDVQPGVGRVSHAFSLRLEMGQRYGHGGTSVLGRPHDPLLPFVCGDYVGY